MLTVALYELHRWYRPKTHDEVVLFGPDDFVPGYGKVLSEDDLHMFLFSGVALRIATEDTMKEISNYAAHLWNRGSDADHAVCAFAMREWLKSAFDSDEISTNIMQDPIWQLKELADDLSKEWISRENPETRRLLGSI